MITAERILNLKSENVSQICELLLPSYKTLEKSFHQSAA